MGAVTAAGFSRLRLSVLLAGSLLVLLAVSGILSARLFAQPTTIKYIVTVLGSLLVALLATFDDPLRALVGIAILTAPFAFVATFSNVQVTPLLVINVLAVLAWLTRPAVRGRSAVRGMTLVFVLALLPALLGSGAPASWLLWLSLTVATGSLAFVIAREPGGPMFVVSMVALSGAIQGAIALWEFRTGHRLNLYQASGSVPVGSEYFFTFGHEARPPGALPDPIGLGQVLALCLPLMVALSAGVRRWSTAAGVLAATALAAVALLLSLSRMSMVGGAIGVAVVLLLLPWRALMTRGLAVAATLALVAVLGMALGGQPLVKRIDSILNPTAAHVYTAQGDLTRLHIWSAAVKTAEANLVTGVGFGNVTKYLPKYGAPVTQFSHAHDTYLQFFAEGGVLGLLALVGMAMAAGVDLVRGFRAHRIWVAGAAGSLVATLLTWITDVEVRYVQVSAMVAVLLGLIAALAFQEEPAPEESPDSVQEPPLRPEEPPSPETPRADEPLVPVGEARVVPGVREPVVPVGRQRPEPVEEAAPAAGPWQTLAIVSPSREDGGAERYLRVIAAAARRRGWAVHAAFPSLDATRTLLGDLQALGIECHGLAVPGSQPAGPAQALRVAAAEARGTLRVLGEVKPTTILTVLPHPDQAPGLVLAAAAYPARAVTSVHLVPPDLELTDARRLLYTLCRGLRQRWIAVSPHSRRELARALRWSERRIDLVHNGVGGDAPRDVGADIRAELGLPPETKLLLTVGRLNRQKGHDVLAESIGAVSRRHPQAHWAWAGDGPARAALTAQLERLGLSGRVSMLGVREDVPRLLAAADLFLFPSRYEGAPLALLEAMAAGVPVIVSDSGPLPEIVRDGVEGLVVRGEDAGALAQATCWALEHENEMSALAAAALRRVASEFSRERMVAHTLALLTPGVRPRRGAVSPALLRTLAGTARLRGAR